MENDDTKRQTRRERGRTIESSQQTKRQQKHTLWRNWKSLSRTRQIEFLFSGLVAIGGIGYLVAYIWISTSQGRQAIEISRREHAPLVIHQRPPVMRAPFTCDAVKRQLAVGNMELFVKNIGNATAIGTDPFITVPKVIAEKRTGDKFWDEIPEADCSAPVNSTPMDFPLPEGIEKSVLLRQAAFPLPPNLEKDGAMQLYLIECVFYRDDSKVRHATCDRYRLSVPDSEPFGTPSFQCDASPRIGIFQESIGGHCQE